MAETRHSSHEKHYCGEKGQLMGEAEMKTMALADLKPSSYNPRSISDAAMKGLQASLKRFGIVQPIVVNKATGRVVGGHQRVKALQANGETEAPVVIVDIPESEEKALNVSLNNREIEGDFTADLGPLLDEIKFDIGDEAFEGLRLDMLMLSNDLEESEDCESAPDGLAYKILVDCRDEMHQIELLGQFEGKMLKCKPLIL